MKNIDKNQLRILAEDELRKCGVNPDYLEIMVTLVNEPDDMQRLSEDYYKLHMKNEVLERRLKAKLREVFYLDLKEIGRASCRERV